MLHVSFCNSPLWSAYVQALHADDSSASPKLERKRQTVSVGYYEISNPGGNPTHLIPPINLAGFTPVRLTTLSAAELATVDIVFATNANNDGINAAWTAALSALDTFVNSGGVVIVHDRFVSIDNVPGSLASIVPGGSVITCDREIVDGNNLFFVSPLTIVSDGSGPGGALSDSSLDNLGISSHGKCNRNTIPTPNVVSVARVGAPTNNDATTFSFQRGNGLVVYSTSPLDFALVVGLQPWINYAANLLVFAHSLAGGAQGDPHLTGANGVKFDFNGEPNGEYSLFSAPQLQVNMHLAGDGPATRFMTEIVVAFRNVTIQVGVQFIRDGYIAQINAQLAPFGAKAIYRDLQLHLFLCPGQSILISQMIANRKLYPTLVHDDGSSFYYLDIAIRTPHCSDAYGGALGQTYKCLFVEGREEFKFEHASEESFRVKALSAVDESSFNEEAPCSAPPTEAARSMIGGASH